MSALASMKPDTSKFYKPETAEFLNPKEKRRVALVTGGNSGIGWYTVLHLYLHGYIVYVAGRTESKVLKAIDDITAEAKKRVAAYTDEEKKTRYLGALSYLHFDACDLATVAQCAEDFASKEAKLHILINNAGVMGVPYELTKDGYEIQYQVNFVAPFLLTFKLLSVLHNATVDQVPRVICLSSIGHNMCVKHIEPSNTINKFPNFLYTWVRYGNAKTAEIQFMKKFSEEYPNLLAFSVHPGVIVETELYNHWKNLTLVGPVAKFGVNLVDKAMGVTSEQGALATLRCALDPSLLYESTGCYFETGGILSKASKIARNRQYIEQTWNDNLRTLEEKGFYIDTHPLS